MSVKPMAGFDMDQRDPNNLNEHLQVPIFFWTLKKWLYDNLHRFCGTISLESPKESRVPNAPGIVLTNASGEREIAVIFYSPPYLRPA